MKTGASALAFGIATEAVLVVIAFVAGIGPCGGSLPGMLILAVHYPGLTLLQKLSLPPGAQLWTLTSLYAAIWSVGWYFILCCWTHRPGQSKG